VKDSNIWAYVMVCWPGEVANTNDD